LPLPFPGQEELHVNEQTEAFRGPESAVLVLARELAQAEIRRTALVRAHRWSLVGLGLAAAIGGFAMGVYVATPAMAEIQGAAGSAAHASQGAPRRAAISSSPRCRPRNGPVSRSSSRRSPG